MTTITKYPRSNAVITTGWTNPTYVYADDTSYATAVPGRNAKVATDYYNFGFDIPGNSIINSIELAVMWRVSTTSSIATLQAQAVKNDSYMGSALINTAEPTSLIEQIFTNVGSWSVAELNDNTQAGGFKVELSGQRGDSGKSVTCYCDYIKVTVDYTEMRPDGYYIERKTGVEGTYVEIAQAILTKSYQDNVGLEAENTYFYRIRKSSRNVWSEYSNEVSVFLNANVYDEVDAIVNIIFELTEDSIFTISDIQLTLDILVDVTINDTLTMLDLDLPIDIPVEVDVNDTLTMWEGNLPLDIFASITETDAQTTNETGKIVVLEPVIFIDEVYTISDVELPSDILVTVTIDDKLTMLDLDSPIDIQVYFNSNDTLIMRDVDTPLNLFISITESDAQTMIETNKIITLESVIFINEVYRANIPTTPIKTNIDIEVIIMNSNFENIIILDSLKSLLWTDRYSSYGDFEIYTPVMIELLPFLQQDYYIFIKESEHIMIIEDLQIKCDVDEGDYLIVTGRSLESLLDRRIVWDQTILTGNFQDGIQTLLTDAIINPSITERKIDNFIFEPSVDPIITVLTIEAQIEKGADLYEVITTLCVEKDIGFKITLSPTNKFVFKLYAGVNRSYDQFATSFVIFSPNFDNIINSNYTESKRIMKNVTLVDGEGELDVRKSAVVGAESALSRRELYISASDLSQNVNDVSIPDSDYIEQLKQRGAEKLAEYILEKSFDGQVDTFNLFKYGEDFFLGDIVQFVNEYGIEGKVRVTEMIYSQDSNGVISYPTFVSVD